MFDDIGKTSYIINQIIFFILLILFSFSGLKLANKTFRKNEQNKKGYYSLMLSCPVGFLIGFFITDSVYPTLIKNHDLMASYSLIAYWLATVFVGIIISFAVSFFMIKKVQKEI